MPFTTKHINTYMKLDITNINKMIASVRWNNKLQREIKALTKFLKNVTWSERIYCITNKLTSAPYCFNCGKSVKYTSFTKGYNHYCSNKCRNTSDDVKNKRRLTNMNKYGGASPMSCSKVQQKAVKTMDAIYGVDNPSQLWDVKEKKKKTLKEHYGVENPSHSDVIQERKRETYQRKYGKDHWTQDPKKKKAFIKQLAEKKMPCESTGNDKWRCKFCDYPFHSIADKPECPICTQKTIQ